LFGAQSPLAHLRDLGAIGPLVGKGQRDKSLGGHSMDFGTFALL
jgi:hypothetical protein